MTFKQIIVLALDLDGSFPEFETRQCSRTIFRCTLFSWDELNYTKLKMMVYVSEKDKITIVCERTKLDVCMFKCKKKNALVHTATIEESTNIGL